MNRQEKIDEMILTLARDPVLAHRTLFRHRHPNTMPRFHVEAILNFHSAHPRVENMSFRGSAKSTIAEECIIIKSCFRQHHNLVIIGETEPKAKERLRSIRNEFETNHFIEELFGNLQGPTWGETKIELSTQVMIQAYGRGQALRGSKYLQWRPQFIFCDDLEDEESVLTKDSREKTKSWFWKTLVGAMENPLTDPIRVAATPLHEEAFAVELSKLPEWKVQKVPIEFTDENGRHATWPDKFPLDVIDKLKANYYKAGRSNDYMQEYMCEVVDPKTKIFNTSMFRHEDMLRTYQPVYVVYDPARTIKERSATTGVVAASWIGHRLIVWEAKGKLWRPDEIINDMFEMDDKYRPVAIGVEEDGLNEFIMQPLRHAQMDRGHPLPIRPLKAPKGKIDFIRSLQPFFNAREVIFAGPPGDQARFADISSQLLNFPTGNIDIPNALAYFLKLRPGMPVYDEFNDDNIMEEIRALRSPTYLAANSTGQHTTAALCQLNASGLRILADYVRDGDPGSQLEVIYREAQLAGAGSGHTVRLYAHQRHFEAYDTIGFRYAAAQIPVSCHRGGKDTAGREEFRRLLRKRATGGFAHVICSTEATWTLRALQGGYSRELKSDGSVASEPTNNIYATLMNGLESFLALQSIEQPNEPQPEFAYTENGTPYLTSRR